ncbi:MAG: 6-hydroxyparomomycin oxidase [Planctomycetota bacterium]
MVIPETGEMYDCDVLVVGSGAGGGTLAAACARRGLSVVVVERGTLPGKEFSALSADQREQWALVEKRPCDDRPFRLNGIDRQFYIGGRAGGSTGLYGAAMLRPQPEDFEPGRFYGSRLPMELHKWPICYDEFAPWLRKAEDLYRVAGPLERGFQPVSSDVLSGKLAGSGSALPLTPTNQRVFERLRAAGHKVWQLPLAIESDKCLRCDFCAGFPCPTGARRSSLQLLEDAIQEGGQLRLLVQTEAVRFQITAGEPDSLLVRDRVSGRESLLRARRYVAASGALGTAALLMASGIAHPQLGRNYMLHCSPIVVGLFLRGTGGADTFIKQLGVSDYYLGTPEISEKMGIVQSLPAPGPEMLRRNGLSWLPVRMLQLLRARMLPMVGIVEDLPNPSNRMELMDGGRISLRHEFSAFDRERSAALSRAIVKLLRKAGAIRVIAGRLPPPEHAGHQCGTARFGSDHRHAVLDPQCRVFSHPRIFVADASFMPTSLGVGPALTVAANALRVGDVICNEL